MRISRRQAFILALPLAPLLAARMALAQDQPSPALSVAGASNYVAETLALGMVAKRQSELALERATDPNVRTFAQLEVSEQDAIAGVLTAAGPTAAELLPERQEMIDQLAAVAAGREFDLAYVEAQIAGHNALLSVQQTMSGDTQPSLEAVTARLAEQAVASHIATLNMIQQLMGGEHIQNVEAAEGAEKAGQAPTGEGKQP